MGRRRSKRGDGEKRRWTAPPPLMRDGDDPGPEGLAILGEIGSPLGALLWKSYRSIVLWADTPAEDRKGLFDPDAAPRRRREIAAHLNGSTPELGEPLEVVAGLLAEPESVDAERVGRAAHRVAEWARSRPASHTRMEFLRAAAAAMPEDPRAALEVAEAARERLRAPMAEAWYFRSIALARRIPDWNTYVLAYLALGSMLMEKGRKEAARASFLKAFRRATRQGRSDLKGAGLHRLFSLEDSEGNASEAARYASEAADAYGRGHPNLPDLARDVGHFWLQHGYYTQAQTVMSVLAGHTPRDQLPSVLGALARASSGAGDAEAFEGARQRLARLPGGTGVAEAWLEVGRGSIHLRQPDMAREAVENAQRLARREPGSQVGFLAGVLLDQIGNGSTAPTQNRKGGGVQTALATKLAGLLSDAGK